QVLLTATVTAAFVSVAGFGTAVALFVGFLVVHSSTAVALKLLSDRGEMDTPHGRLSAGILVIQDLSVVPMMLLIPLLAGGAAVSLVQVGTALGKAVLVVAMIVVGARLLLPQLLALIVRLRIRELFTLTVVLFCLGTAWLAAQFGLTIAFGALVAGLVISESEYSHQAIAEILPFRDLFNSIFFTSVGMLLHTDVLVQHTIDVLVLLAIAIALKGTIIGVVVALTTGSVRTAGLTSAALCQIGELAFVLAQFAAPLQLFTPAQYDLFLAVTVLSMVL